MVLERFRRDDPVAPPVEVSADVVECFRRLSQGPSIRTLQRRRKKKRYRYRQLLRKCDAQAMVVAETFDQEEFAKLRGLQALVRAAKKRVTELDRQIDDRSEHPDTTAEELAAIAALPQVIKIRTASPETIVITVVASIKVMRKYYHLGTWDIYFGKFGGLWFGVAPLSQPGSGDGANYRVRRVVETRRNPSVVGTNFYNWGDGSFCFGVNKGEVDALAGKKEYLHTVQTMITYLSWVSPGSKDDVPILFEQLHRKDVVA